MDRRYEAEVEMVRHLESVSKVQQIDVPPLTLSELDMMISQLKHSIRLYVQSPHLIPEGSSVELCEDLLKEFKSYRQQLLM